MATFGDLLRLARQLRGFTQKKASDDLGIAQAVLSRMENGLVEPDPQFIERAASVFDLPAEFFSIQDTVYGPPVSVHTMLRGKKSEVSARDVDMITAELNIRLFHLRRFMENVDLNPANELPVLDVEVYGSIPKIASVVRSHWKVVNGPMKNLTLLMEKAGIIVGESSFHGAPVSGVTFAAPGRPPLILVNRDHPADRLRFTLAHELGHLVMHRFPTARMEDEANQFASAFLLPPQEMVEAFRGRKVTLELLASLKKEWRVSMQSLLMSAQSLNAISDNQARYLWQQISARGWRTREPAALDFSFDAPTVLPSILRSHLDDLGFDVAELVQMSRVREWEFRELYGSLDRNEPTRPRLRIVT
ncbi:XRE family transcriptional regulator [Mesorhizobium sp.]|uniref:helix-turn-helix domain-containing protein n=1 Tax=Mesorhizobium sp. TaxID=1871066 RepID=UPI000FE57A17|nr:XRE family transcriptional regulator [Mesorhizobium sp.]RWQ44759.1 MAG: ImmA/IrrE family metallo-endopeptidase [Mesorhizobium sp.]TIX46002.1 MAG: ImmA/IrrE family metallo-endopeptidase [Mesorhizobium sp.]